METTERIHAARLAVQIVGSLFSDTSRDKPADIQARFEQLIRSPDAKIQLFKHLKKW